MFGAESKLPTLDTFNYMLKTLFVISNRKKHASRTQGDI